MTIREALREAVERYHTIEQVTLRALLRHVTGWDHAAQAAHPDDYRLDQAQVEGFLALAQRASQGEPLPYLTGQQEFFGLAFEVSPDVLIPRPETELLVEMALQFCREHPERRRIVDVGTGSGIIALTLAHYLPDYTISATDLSAAALAVAQRNAERLHLSERLRFVETDLLAALPGPFDLIAANLPYVDQDELITLPIQHWEPHIALSGGKDGVELIARLLDQAQVRMAAGGLILLEVGYDHGPQVLRLGAAAFPGAEVRLFQDLARVDRVVRIKLPESFSRS
ncbi:MAG: peptide chain release factor N(5)-glutamine methyltransferase [Chloroflexi bacterium]|nr:peptide chain release factor N(5)-glutamine methyltransferase [Chloroflexota bacterium]